MSDLISRQAAIEAVKKHYRTHDNDLLELIAFDIERLPTAQGKPFNLPEIYIADNYDTIEGEDGNVGFGVYVPDENQIYVAGDVEGEIRARALLHEICHWVQAMCGRSFDEDEANEFSDIVYDALPSAQPEKVCIAKITLSEEQVREAVEKAKSETVQVFSSEQPERKKGKWIDKSNGIEGAWNYCSVCGEQAIDLYDFCPNCGADMRGEPMNNKLSVANDIKALALINI